MRPSSFWKELEGWSQRASPKIELHEVCAAVYSLNSASASIFFERRTAMDAVEESIILRRIEEISANILIKKEKIETLKAEMELLTAERSRLRSHLDSVNLIGVESELVPRSANRGSAKVNRVETDSDEAIRNAIRPGSIKEAVVEILGRHPDGLIALDVLGQINKSRETPLERTSLSPQLSRLQRAGIIENDMGTWRLVRTQDQSPLEKFVRGLLDR